MIRDWPYSLFSYIFLLTFVCFDWLRSREGSGTNSCFNNNSWINVKVWINELDADRNEFQSLGQWHNLVLSNKVILFNCFTLKMRTRVGFVTSLSHSLSQVFITPLFYMSYIKLNRCRRQWSYRKLLYRQTEDKQHFLASLVAAVIKVDHLFLVVLSTLFQVVYCRQV